MEYFDVDVKVVKVSRHLSLRLGYTPAPELVRAQRKKFRSYQNLATTYIPVNQPDSLYDDINLKRPDLSEPKQKTGTDNLNDMAEENRISGIETDVSGLKEDVGSLKNDMTSLNDKMDELLTAMTRLNPAQQPPTLSDQQPPTHARPAGTEPRTQSQPHENSSMNNHSIHRNRHNSTNSHHNDNNYSTEYQPQYRPLNTRNMSQDEFVKREMEKDRFTYAEPGKNNDSTPVRLFAKPYMYMYRDGLSTTKHKLEARSSITAPEYVDAFLSLLSDPRAFHPDDYPDIFDHLPVSRDALERPWNAVRRWTQYIWDEVEAGAIVWADRDIIQEEHNVLDQCIQRP